MLARYTFLILASAWILHAFAAAPAMAQEAAGKSSVNPERTSGQWGAGAGISFKRKAYRDIGTDTTAIPLLTYENRWIRFAGPTIDLKLPSPRQSAFVLRARYALEDGYEADDAVILNGMAERKPGLWLGGGALWRHDIANVTFEWLADASGRSDGQRFRVEIEKSYLAKAFLLTPRLALSWLDPNYVDYYYGVAPSESRPGRPAYQGSSAIATELGLRSVYAFSMAHSVFLDLSASKLGDAIEDSPLVDRSIESAVRFGYVYRFR